MNSKKGILVLTLLAMLFLVGCSKVEKFYSEDSVDYYIMDDSYVSSTEEEVEPVVSTFSPEEGK